MILQYIFAEGSKVANQRHVCWFLQRNGQSEVFRLVSTHSPLIQSFGNLQIHLYAHYKWCLIWRFQIQSSAGVVPVCFVVQLLHPKLLLYVNQDLAGKFVPPLLRSPSMIYILQSQSLWLPVTFAGISRIEQRLTLIALLWYMSLCC